VGVVEDSWGTNREDSDINNFAHGAKREPARLGVMPGECRVSAPRCEFLRLTVLT